MVGFDMDARSDRAQLILVGAVAIAFIVLGLAVVFNTVLYTDNVASTGAASEPRNAQIENQAVEFGAKELIARTNVDGKWLSESDALAGTDDNVSKYSEGLLRVQGESSGAVVSVEALDTSEGGNEVMGATIQHDGGQFVDAGGSNENWSVVSSGAAPFGEFNMTIDANSLASEGSDDMFRAVWNASDTENNYTVWIYEDDDPEGNVAIRTFTDSDSSDPVNYFGSESAECVIEYTNDADDRVEFDFSEGEIVNSSKCSDEIDISDGIPSEETRTLSFHRGESVTGEYDLTVNEETAVGSGVTPPSLLTLPIGASQSPYWTHAVWKITLAVTYDSGQVSFDERYDIEVYNRSR